MFQVFKNIIESVKSFQLSRQSDMNLYSFPLHTQHNQDVEIVPITLKFSSDLQPTGAFLNKEVIRSGAFGKDMAVARCGGGYLPQTHKIYLPERHVYLSKADSKRYEDFKHHLPQEAHDEEIARKISAYFQDYQAIADVADMTVTHEEKHRQNHKVLRSLCANVKNYGSLTEHDLVKINTWDELGAYSTMLFKARNEYLKQPSEEKLNLFSWSKDMKELLTQKTPKERIDFLKDENKLFKAFEPIFYHSHDFFDSHAREFDLFNVAQKLLKTDKTPRNETHRRNLMALIQNSYMTFNVYRPETKTEEKVCIKNIDRNPEQFEKMFGYLEKARI